ncbi:MAG: ATP synthase F1 subunit delta [Clostridiales Family XIII bacterium]|jgi:ATP synthase F1 delta subunit|nr:ATP synthase F1 subunit delta [Clostridiales Family XIII bacterium]
MDNLTVAAVYGEGLFEAASDIGDVEGLRRELEAIERVLSDYPAFFALLKTPTLSAEQRKASAEKVFAGRVSKELLNFLYVLIDKRRIGQIRGIVKAFDRLADEREGVVKGDLYSVVELTEDQIERFEQETGKLLNKRVKLQNERDASLIGGVRIYIDGKLIDASVRGRLNSLKEKLLLGS